MIYVRVWFTTAGQTLLLVYSGRGLLPTTCGKSHGSWILRALVLCFIFKKQLFSRVHATLQPAMSVRRSHFTFFYDFISLTSLLLPKWSSDFKYGPCPPARDFGSCVSGLFSSKWRQAEICNLIRLEVMIKWKWKEQFKHALSGSKQNWLLHFILS